MLGQKFCPNILRHYLIMFQGSLYEIVQRAHTPTEKIMNYLVWLYDN